MPLPVHALLKSGYRESDTRFSTSGFFHESIPPRFLSIPWALSPAIYNRRCYEIYENPEQGLTTDVYDSFVFIAGVNDTGGKLLTGVVDTCDKHKVANITANFVKI